MTLLLPSPTIVHSPHSTRPHRDQLNIPIFRITNNAERRFRKYWKNRQIRAPAPPWLLRGKPEGMRLQGGLASLRLGSETSCLPGRNAIETSEDLESTIATEGRPGGEQACSSLATRPVPGLTSCLMGRGLRVQRRSPSSARSRRCP